GLPRRLRIGVLISAALTFDVRPAVILALFNKVELVGGLVTEFCGPQSSVIVESQALDIAVSVRENRRVERVIFGGITVLVNAQNLSVQRSLVLRVLPVFCVTGGRIQKSVGPEHYLAAVMVHIMVNASEHVLGVAQFVVFVAHLDDAVIVRGR